MYSGKSKDDRSGCSQAEALTELCGMSAFRPYSYGCHKEPLVCGVMHAIKCVQLMIAISITHAVNSGPSCRGIFE